VKQHYAHDTMDDLAIPLIWLFSVVIGCLVGAAKGRIGSGLVWSLLFGSPGVIVVLCLPNLAKKEEDAKAQQLLQSQVQLQQAQLCELQALVTAVAARPAAQATAAAPPEVVYYKTTCPSCGVHIEHTAFNGWVDCPQCRRRVNLAIVDDDGDGEAAG
jgi:hypothetical protein